MSKRVSDISRATVRLLTLTLAVGIAGLSFPERVPGADVAGRAATPSGGAEVASAPAGDVVAVAKELARAGKGADAGALLERSVAEAGLAPLVRARRFAFLARLKASARDQAGALKAMEQALALDPYQPEATALKASTMASGRDLAGALVLMAQVSERGKASPEFQFTWAQLLCGQKRYPEALQALERAKALPVAPAERTELLVLAAQVATQTRSWDAAERDLFAAVAASPEPAALDLLVKVQVAKGDTDAASATLARLKSALGPAASQPAQSAVLAARQREIDERKADASNLLPPMVGKLRRSPGSAEAEAALASVAERALASSGQLIAVRAVPGGYSAPPPFVKEGTAKADAAAPSNYFLKVCGEDLPAATRLAEAHVKVFATSAGYERRAHARAAAGKTDQAARDWFIAAALQAQEFAETGQVARAEKHATTLVEARARIWQRIRAGRAAGDDLLVSTAHAALAKKAYLEALDAWHALRQVFSDHDYGTVLYGAFQNLPGRPAFGLLLDAGAAALARGDVAAAEKRSGQLVMLTEPDVLRERYAMFLVDFNVAKGDRAGADETCRQWLVTLPYSPPLWSWMAGQHVKKSEKESALLAWNAAAGGKATAALGGQARAAAAERDRLEPSVEGGDVMGWYIAKLNAPAPLWQSGLKVAAATRVIDMGANGPDNIAFRAERRRDAGDLQGAEADALAALKLDPAAKVQGVLGEVHAHGKRSWLLTVSGDGMNLKVNRMTTSRRRLFAGEGLASEDDAQHKAPAATAASSFFVT